jgi:hypothetical protein
MNMMMDGYVDIGSSASSVLLTFLTRPSASASTALSKVLPLAHVSPPVPSNPAQSTVVRPAWVPTAVP